MYSFEVRDEDTTDGAIFCADLAFVAKAVIDGGEVILNLDRARGAILFALFTSDTSVTALLSCQSALILVITSDKHSLDVVHNADYSSRASLCAKSATDAFSRIDMRHSVLDADSLLRTDLDTVAKSDTTVGTFSVAAVHSLYRLAGANTHVIHLMSGMLAVAVTVYDRHLLDNVLCLDAKNSGDILRALVSTGDTKVSLVTSALCESLCITVASRISAGTTVSTGETVADSEGALILFYSKENVCNGKECGANEADSGKE